MRQAIIHIGTTKTGTTSIQRVLGRNRAILPEQGVCYPITPGVTEHVKLHVMLFKRRMNARGLTGRNEPRRGAVGIDEFPELFAQEMRSLPASVKRVIFSEERLSILRGEDEIQALKDFLAPYFDDFKIVVYLRSQDSYLASRYSELLRVGTMDGPDNVVATPERLAPYDYLALIDRWAAVFGESAMVPRLYERGAAKTFDSVDDFLGVCGLSLPVPPDDPSRLRNPSMSYAGQQLMLRMATLVKDSGDERLRGNVWFEVSAAVTAGMPGQGWLPTRDEAATFMKRFSAGNEIIRQRYFPERKALFADGSARFPLEPMHVAAEEMLDAACLAFFNAASRAAAKERPAPRTMEVQTERQLRRAQLRDKVRPEGTGPGKRKGQREPPV